MASSSTAPDPPTAPGPSEEPVGESSQPSQQSFPTFQTLPEYFTDWEIINEPREFYDERDCLDPSHNFASETLSNRSKDDVAIFDYSLNPEYLGHEEDGASSPPFGADGDIFLRVSRDEFIKSERFDELINRPGRDRLLQSRGPRLGIIDFLQCYDTHDGNPLNSMAEKLGIHEKGKTTFMQAYSQRIRALPGRGCFRTGISLRAPWKKLSESSKEGSSEDRFILFLSFPYFGTRKEINVSPESESESTTLLDFKRLRVGTSDRKTAVSEGVGGGVGKTAEKDRGDKGKRLAEGGGGNMGEASAEEGSGNLGKILVHQARYMIFDNHIMAAFRSKEDNAENQVPLHRFQERVGAFRAMVHMIANRTDSELWILEELQYSLCKLEEDIDQMILDAKIHEDNQGMEKSPDDDPQKLGQSPKKKLTREQRLEWEERTREDNVRKRKHERVRKLLASLNSLSAALFATITVAERQIAVLQDLRNVFLTSYRRKPFHKNVAPIPILSENREQILPNTIDTINEVVQERESFIRKVKGLVENMDIRRKIFSAFLKSDQAKVARTEKAAEETTEAVMSTKEAIGAATAAIEATQNAINDTKIELVQQSQVLTSFTLLTTAFLPLGFATSYFGMNNIKEFNGDKNLRSLFNFWTITAPLVLLVMLVTLIVVIWKRPWAEGLRSFVESPSRENWVKVRKEWGANKERRRTSSKGEAGDIEAGLRAGNSQSRTPNGSPNQQAAGQVS